MTTDEKIAKSAATRAAIRAEIAADRLAAERAAASALDARWVASRAAREADKSARLQAEDDRRAAFLRPRQAKFLGLPLERQIARVERPDEFAALAALRGYSPWWAVRKSDAFVLGRRA